MLLDVFLKSANSFASLAQENISRKTELSSSVSCEQSVTGLSRVRLVATEKNHKQKNLAEMQ